MGAASHLKWVLSGPHLAHRWAGISGNRKLAVRELRLSGYGVYQANGWSASALPRRRDSLYMHAS